jgi:bifunctional DNA-binding transcriptional regulator/antitoxin component of YhaV-PrlF toxin-antitoxin module
MKTRLTSKGQFTLPFPLLREMGVRVGDLLDVKIQDGSIVLTPHRRPRCKSKIVIDPLTGLPVLTLSGKTAPLTSKQVEEILVNFP